MFDFMETMLFETHHESIMDQAYINGHKTTVSKRGSWSKNHQKPFLCCLLKCCPRYRNGTAANNIEKTGRKAPQGPMPPLNSFQIALKTPIGVALPGGGESILTDSSVGTMIPEANHLTNI